MTHDPHYEALAQEYRDYAYIVSHDLNAPLRHLKQFSQLLIDEMDPQEFNEDQKLYLHFIRTSLDKLDTMQSRLLEFSRVNTQQEPPVRLNPLDTITQAAREITEQYAGRSSPSINIQDKMPDIIADPRQFMTLILYVLENAVKFSARTRNVEIEIRAAPSGQNIVFTICDNGIGIPQEFRTDVFRMFRKLHTDDEYPGTGAGLSISKKIIERHDGTINITDSRQGGTCVTFTLPAFSHT